MPRLMRPRRGIKPVDRPSRMHIFARRQRRMIRPVLFSGLLLVLAGYGLHVAHMMRSEHSFAPMRAQIARTSGLHVTDIVVEGRSMTQEGQLMAALGVSKGDPLLGFSVEAARRRIDQLAFVEHSTIERRLPGTVVVQLVERRPFAVWQTHDRFVLIDRNGEIVAQQAAGRKPAALNAKDAEAFAELPLVVGAGAPKAASGLIDALAAEPVVQRQVMASVRIGMRRWNLSLRSGAEVLLPEGAEPQALHRLAQLDDDMHLLTRPVAAIDMRLPDRLVVRTRPPASPQANSPEANSPEANSPEANSPGPGGQDSTNPYASPPALQAPSRRPA